MRIAEQNVELVDYMGSDLSVVNAARVSFHKQSDWDFDIEDGLANNLRIKESDAKLIAYLAKHGHWTPFGHAFLSFRIKSPIFVARQLVKHQVGLVWNEVSRRYVDEEPEFWFPKVWRGRPVNAKQGSSDVVFDPVELLMYDLNDEYTNSPESIVHETVHFYNQLIKAGVAPEQARMVLPQNMMTEWIWSGSLAAFARVCRLRMDPHAQAETREVAEKIDALVPDDFQHSWKALRSG
jgi:thymidylate synthase (FAD)